MCLLETGRRPPPSPEVVAALAKALGTDARALQEQADLARAPEPLRRRLAGLDREKDRVRRSRDRILTTTLFHVTRRPGFMAEAVAEALGLPEERRLLLGRIAHRVRQVPTAEQAASRADDLLKDLPGRDRNALVRALPRLLSAGGGGPAAAALPLDAPLPVPAGEDRPWRSVPVVASVPEPGQDPARHARDAMHVDRRLYRAGCWLWAAEDDDAYPRIERGDLLLVDPHGRAGDGDWVVWRDGARARVRRLRTQGEEVVLESPRPDVPPIRLATAAFHPAGVVGWVFRPLRGMPPPRRPHLA